MSRAITAIYYLTPRFLPYFECSIKTVPSDVPVIVLWYGEGQPPESTFGARVTFLRPAKRTEHSMKAYCLNVGIRQAKTPWILIADADMIFPSFFFDLLEGPCPANVVRRCFVGRLCRETTQRIMAAELAWEDEYTDYEGRPERFTPSYPERAVAKLVKFMFRRLGVSYGRERLVYSDIYGTPNPCVYSMELLERLHGYDEAFVGWGQEDDDLAYRGRRLGAIDRRLPIVVGHLYHPRLMDFKNYIRGANFADIMSRERPAQANPDRWGDLPA